MSGLCINFHKIKNFGINLEENFLDATSNFLSCERFSFPFVFLGKYVEIRNLVALKLNIVSFLTIHFCDGGFEESLTRRRLYDMYY